MHMYRNGNSNDLSSLLIKLVDEQKVMQKDINEIEKLTKKTTLLSFNSSIEAARAGEAGRGFSVIADEVKSLASQSSQSNKNCNEAMKELTKLINDIAGVRTADIAFDLIDKIDRNLFERNCDVQAWATFSLVKNAAQNTNEEAGLQANKLLHNICDLYEVYYDIFLADINGTLIGAANRTHLLGNDVSKEEWFTSVKEADKNTVLDLQILDDVAEYTVAYNAPVRDEHNNLIGVISTRFNWNFIYDIIDKAKVSSNGNVYVVNSSGKIIASRNREDVFCKDISNLPVLNTVIQGNPYGYMLGEDKKGKLSHILGYAHTCGYNAYKGKNWSVIVEETF